MLWWQVLGSNQRRLSRRFYRGPPDPGTQRSDQPEHLVRLLVSLTSTTAQPRRLVARDGRLFIALEPARGRTQVISLLSISDSLLIRNLPESLKLARLGSRQVPSRRHTLAKPHQIIGIWRSLLLRRHRSVARLRMSSAAGQACLALLRGRLLPVVMSACATLLRRLRRRLGGAGQLIDAMVDDDPAACGRMRSESRSSCRISAWLIWAAKWRWTASANTGCAVAKALPPSAVSVA